MPIYKAKQFDSEKIQEIVKAHPNHHFKLGMKEDWFYVHCDLTYPNQANVEGIDSSWWDTPVIRIYDSENNFITELEVWKEITYESSEESRKLNEELLKDLRERRKKLIELNQTMSL